MITKEPIMTDQQFDCHMQMLSAIFDELKAVRGLIEKVQAPKAINILNSTALADFLRKKESEEYVQRLMEKRIQNQPAEEQ